MSYYTSKIIYLVNIAYSSQNLLAEREFYETFVVLLLVHLFVCNFFAELLVEISQFYCMELEIHLTKIAPK